MTDTIIKGTGNSRSIKSVTTLPLTWEDARAQLISSGWPVDIGAINAAGCQQVGDALSKANLLKDETAALYGLGGTATPNDILSAIRPLITEAHDVVGIATGSFVWSSGQSGVKTVTLGFKPKFFICSPNKAATVDMRSYFTMSLGTGKKIMQFGLNYGSVYVSTDGSILEDGVSFSLPGGGSWPSITYYYLAIK